MAAAGPRSRGACPTACAPSHGPFLVRGVAHLASWASQPPHSALPQNLAVSPCLWSSARCVPHRVEHIGLIKALQHILAVVFCDQELLESLATAVAAVCIPTGQCKPRAATRRSACAGRRPYEPDVHMNQMSSAATGFSRTRVHRLSTLSYLAWQDDQWPAKITIPRIPTYQHLQSEYYKIGRRCVSIGRQNGPTMIVAYGCDCGGFLDFDMLSTLGQYRGLSSKRVSHERTLLHKEVRSHLYFSDTLTLTLTLTILML